ncbi:GPI biosynthesis protein family Pig-F-domain-containing protein [Hygrophoropsis aurantiaca]|uniref:GPI biosynthesis protein family Pig-F-domain-containing protein n=1 Tax=Hygrophoropsis aurantiaca TaxID=72124 RepID=A0ACB8ACG2_9AGAM|nr:GPI biosynthesis protein family Pig-F-domain-containing protein [Hygrophoropsis aurantiaca]
MPARKTKSIPNEPISQVKPINHQIGFFPFARYTSVVGVHSILIVFTALFLPQTSFIFAKPEERVTDRPQSQFLEALTISPVLTLLWVCGGTVLLQSWWAGWMRIWCFDYNARGNNTELKLERVQYQKSRFARFSQALTFTLAVSLVFHFIIVLFGAPIAGFLPHTFLLALILSFLTVFTPAYAIGQPSLADDTGSLIIRFTWVRLFAELSSRNAMERAMVYPAFGAIVGCWSGAIPIALDWDRPWQAWPLTPLFGSITGYILGSLSAVVVSAIHLLAEEHIKSQQPIKEKAT